MSRLHAVSALRINVSSVALYFLCLFPFSVMLFYRQNHNEDICTQMIDSLTVPVSSTFSYFCAKQCIFKDPGNFRNPTDLSQGLPTTFLTLNAVESPQITLIFQKRSLQFISNFCITLCFYGAYFGVIRMHAHFTCYRDIYEKVHFRKFACAAYASPWF